MQANEPRAPNAEPYESENGEMLCKWVVQMISFIKGLDQNHMVLVGDEGHRTDGNPDVPYPWLNTGNSGSNFTCNTLAADAGTVHTYPEQWGIPASDYEWIGDNYIVDRANLVHSMGKPIIYEEYGLSGTGYLPNRNEAIKYLQDVANSADYACTMVWAVSHYSVESFNPDKYFGSNDNQGTFTLLYCCSLFFPPYISV